MQENQHAKCLKCYHLYQEWVIADLDNGLSHVGHQVIIKSLRTFILNLNPVSIFRAPNVLNLECFYGNNVVEIEKTIRH